MKSVKKKNNGKVRPVDIPLKRKLRNYLNYGFLGFKLIIFILFVLLCFTKVFHNITSQFAHRIIEYTGELGFELDHVIISGQKNLTTDQILATLNADVGTPILEINLNEVHQRLMDTGWVSQAIVKRKLPDKIIIQIEEKVPLALWQYNQQIVVIDSEGKIIPKAKSENFNLLHVVGTDANIRAKELVNLLNNLPNILSKVTSAVRFGERRWNLNLQENITVQLPQLNISKALNYLNQLDQSNKLLGQNYKNIDLRDESRYYIERYQ